MADITKCLGRDCKKRDKCIRYIAKDTPQWQSYSDFDLMAKCKYFIKKGK